MNTPKILDWPYPMAGDLFHAGDRSFIETTEAAYYEQLGAVPPIRQLQGAFMVGEEATHDGRGCPIFSAFYYVDGRVFCRYETVLEFDSRLSPGLIRAQIAQEGS